MARAVALVPEPEREPRRWEFSKVGLSYVVTAEEIQTSMSVSRLKRSSEGISGDLKVTTQLEGVKTRDGLLHHARFNLSSSQTRNSVAKILEGRTPKLGMDWFDGLEALCQEVMAAESIGQPYLELGNLPFERSAVRYAVEPLVPARVTSLLYGPGGSGKSIIALAGAMSVKTGIGIIPGVSPAITGPILYLDWETDGSVINERVQSIAAGAGIDPPTIIYRRCFRPLAAEAEEIANAVAERGVVFMIIDSAGMALGGAGEHGDANESTLRLFDAIRHIGVSTQLIDHVSKQEMRTGKGKSVGLLPYGSIYKVNLARSAWEIRNVTGEEDVVAQVALIHTKSNDSQLLPQIGLEIEWKPGEITFHTANIDLDAPPTNIGTVMEQIRAFLEKNGGPARLKEISEATGIGTGSASGTLDRYKGVFVRIDRGVYDIVRKPESEKSPWEGA
jgi:hypothetical protein